MSRRESIRKLRSLKYQAIKGKNEEKWDCFFDEVNGHAHYTKNKEGDYEKTGLCLNRHKCLLYPENSHWKQKNILRIQYLLS